ncbi:MAG: GntG family PLP-dependent aldolase, partial [Planctomycetota bacterium]|nr:GntG family PLP-dependent aldolase [Planctomycetota bacterium]
MESDFRSDTVTRPCAAMRAAMAAAEVGDDVLDGDPTVAALEKEGAAWLGKDGALFVPSGTMANQIAMGAWTRPGDELIAEREAHVLVYEAGAAGALHGLQSVTLAGHKGALDPAQVAAALRPDFVHCPRTGLVCVEQTHMASGGSVVPLENLRAVAEVARAAGVAVHMDGARLAHAVVASGVAARDYAACADSVSLCLSKGLGAPVGSLIAGPAEFLERARRVRKQLGGWMRQAGIIAAAGRMALAENVERLADDHLLAKELAAVVEGFSGLGVPAGGPETNLVPVRVEREGLGA